MAKVIATCGIISSGKSSWAKEVVENDPENWVRISKDDLRTLLHDGQFIKGVTEEKVIQARDALISKFLVKGMGVLVDDTNLKAAHVKQIKRIADDLNADFEIKYFPVELEEAIRRDKERENSVGEDVIRGMWDQFNLSKGLPEFDLPEKKQIEPYVPDTTKPKAVALDIDGTLAKMNGRSPYDYSLVSSDLPNKPVIETALAFAEAEYNLIFVSGREDICFWDTVSWLDDNLARYISYMPQEDDERCLIVSNNLFMRKSGDYRKDSQIKEEMFNEHIRDNYNVLLVLDDRQQTVDRWRALGLTCLQVAEGNH